MRRRWLGLAVAACALLLTGPEAQAQNALTAARQLVRTWRGLPGGIEALQMLARSSPEFRAALAEVPEWTEVGAAGRMCADAGDPLQLLMQTTAHLPPIGGLDDMPRAQLGQLPTPIVGANGLSAALGGPDIYFKRDDLTGVGFGGNKIRQLEFYLGDAVEQGADAVLITGSIQSNYVRQAAASARRLGMTPHLLLEERVAGMDDLYHSSGNVFLDELLGAEIRTYEGSGSSADESGGDRALDEWADELRAAGRKPYVVHLGPGHLPLGATGYVAAADEILAGLAASEQLGNVDTVVVASGSGYTHAGLLFGLRARGSDIRVIGVCVRREAAAQRERIEGHMQGLSELLGIPSPVVAADIELIDAALPPGYGQVGPHVVEAIELTARTEGVFLDPVYTGKAMAGMIGAVRDGTIPADANVLFVHTGGQPALFGYQNVLKP